MAKNKRIFINELGDSHHNVPNLLEIQTESYRDFIQADVAKANRKRRGLQEVLMETFPIKDFTENIILEFIDYDLGLPPPEEWLKKHQNTNQKWLMDECPEFGDDYHFAKFGDQTYRIKFSPEECQKRDLTYGIPLNMRIRLINKLSGEIKEQELFVVNLPLMTTRGTFIINGAERVVVSQLHRSPGVYYEYNKAKKIYQGKIVPYRGAWLEFDLDVMRDLFHIRIDRKRKVPVTQYLRVLGMNDEEMVQELDHGDTLNYIKNTLKVDKTTDEVKSLEEIYRKLRPGEPFIFDNAKQLVQNLYGNAKRYDLGEVGRYKFNKKMGFIEKLSGQFSVNTIKHPTTDKILVEADAILDADIISSLVEARIDEIRIRTLDDIEITAKRPKQSFLINFSEGEGLCQSQHEGVCVSGDVFDTETNELIIADGEPLENETIFRLVDRQKNLKQKNLETLNDDVEAGFISLQKHCVVDTEDIIHTMKYIIDLSIGVGFVDDIDHLGHRRIRRVGELLQNQFRVSLARMDRVIKERMTIQDVNNLTPQLLINTRAISSSIDEFFGSSQLSQFMDQVNPLSELTHKRRLSALGPGGLKRERAGYEVRDVHPTHFGRICPIETPEGPNAGLIGSLAICARLDRYGFLITPLRHFKGKKPEENFEYMDALMEEKYRVVPYNQGFYTSDKLLDKVFPVKQYVEGEQDFTMLKASEAELIHISPLQMISIASSLIPFIEHDDANRALMGTNMQRQAVPLVKTDSPIVGTGMESYTAQNSGACVSSKFKGEVVYTDACLIRVKRLNKEDCYDNFGPEFYSYCENREVINEIKDTKGKTLFKVGHTLITKDIETLRVKCEETICIYEEKIDKYPLRKYARSNQGTCVNQKPCVRVGELVEANEVIADGPSTSNGELSLGKNVICAFMPFRGYNFEDAIVLSERLVHEDVYTSVHISSLEVEARDTKLGAEEITRDIPSISEDALSVLDDNGIIQIGAEVTPGDILVGKITPKGETELTAEDKLLRAIFGEKAKEVRNTSLVVPHGGRGKVIDVIVFSRETKDELPYGVNKLVRVYLAQKRIISEGDKMAGRHGNKGVISKIFPRRDMPFLADGTTVDVILNPLGVPSRMNLGQVMETHLGWAGRVLGEKYATSSFNEHNYISNEDFLSKKFKESGMPETGRMTLYDGENGEAYAAPIMVGVMYMLKLIHLVEDKIHARSTGPYSLVTQQPLGGKAQFGGQRFGEMEVWALEAYGAAHVLRELLTIKSDDVEGRVVVYENIVKGNNVMTPNIPESFKVIISELKGLGLNIEFNQDKGN
ncbi:MAG: DNA-directed RNA polymerase subunit beta [Candidatus Cloacimonadota bacterium]|nr:MAG: DNA-directed RNA polymerase subunit beta [Candidatus Cloacimonadota bacterium]